MTTEKLLFHLEQPHGAGDIFAKWQNGPGNYIAVTGCDSIVNIFDRYGQIRERIRLQGLCSDFAWDSDGDLLGVICQSSQLTVWDATNGKKQTVDVGLRDSMTCLLWCKSSPILAVGTAKGNVSIYNHNTSRRTPIIGKHTKKITCGAWNVGNLLALGSEDKTLSISTADGDTLRVISLRAEPADIQFSEMKLDERVGGENTVSVVVGKRTLYLYNLLDPDNPIELAFQQHYGAIVTYRWYGDGYILLGFSAGFFIAISTHIKEVGQELFQIRNHKNNLTDIAISNAISKVASCGDNTIKIHDMSNLQETSSIITLSHETGVEKISWSPDGQLLACCTRSGSLNVYISHMPTLTSVCGPRMAVLSSLTEVSLYNYTIDKSKLVAVPVALEMEPSFISVGPYHLAAGLNNRVWIYDLTRSNPESEDSPLFLRDQQYLGAVTSIKVNVEYISVLFEGKIQLHMIEQTEVSDEDRGSIIIPGGNASNALITCHALTTEFLIYGTNMGQIIYFFIEDWANTCEYKHSVGIKSFYVDPSGTRLIFFDENCDGYLYNAVNNEVIQVPDLRNKIAGVIWDSHLPDRNIFIAYDDYDIDTYIYIKVSTDGSTIKKVGKTTLVSKQIPLLMYSGEVMLAASGGQLTQLILSTHESSPLVTDRDLTASENTFNKQIALHKFSDAWKTCQLLNQPTYWNKFATEALKHLELDYAIQIYRHLEDIGMVWSLEDLWNVEDHKLLAGHMALHLKEFDKAQQWFLSSSFPKAALEMRRDLLQWDQALQLAKKLAPDQIPFISREYAQQLEFTGNYAEAYVHYEKGIQDTYTDEHNTICKSGIARTSLRVGNFKHGINIATDINSKQLYKECAEILESKKQLTDAANLFEKCHSFDKAASAYIKLKNWQKVGELLPNITSSKIHSQYAKAKEKEGKYEEASDAYQMAKDYDSVIRLQVEYLNNPEAAVELVQETKSVEGAKLVARFFQRLNDYPSAIRFLVLSHCNDEAFELARKHGKLALYGEVLLNTLSTDDVKPQDFVSLALHFENERNYLLSGKYWFHAREFQKAMKHLQRAAKINSDENEALTIAIDVVASSNDDDLFTNLIEFLLGETDGLPKDPKYLFRLYMARKQYKEAAKTAIIIASEEQVNGNYRNAHDVLFSMYQELKHNGIRIPNEMIENLMLLHSYILVRLHVKNGDHYKGARMLIRVANNISKFPSHVVPILTSTVIECHRAGLKQSAFTFAAMLMRSEYRSQVDPKYAKKIEAVVRKPPKIKEGDIGDPIETNTACPFCETLLPETEINCSKCKSYIPFCIATGRHIVKTDLTACPECNFPALYTEFMSVLNVEDICPMCSEKVDSRRLNRVSNIEPFLNISVDN